MERREQPRPDPADVSTAEIPKTDVELTIRG
jgi:hypothetical protein